MAQAFRCDRGRDGGPRYVAHLDEDERALVGSLFDQTRELVTPPPPPPAAAPEPTGDPFTDLVRTSGLLDDGDALATLDGAAEDEDADPALGRLVPDGHHDDPIAAAEFRALTSRSIRETKSARLTTAIEALDRATGETVTLDADEAPAFLAALTDVRLVIGERLGLHSDADAEALADVDERDPRYLLAMYYEFLTWLQETLAEALLTTFE